MPSEATPFSIAFRPRLLETLRGYRRVDFRTDLVAGLTVDVIALSLAMAPAIATTLEALDDLHEKLAAKQRHLILCGPHTQPLFALQKAGFIDRIGLDNLCGDMESALARARELLAT